MEDTLIQIEIEQDLPGFKPFFGCWVWPGETTVLVDTGPAATRDRLLKSLDKLGLSRVDYILLTHIHIDHSGGVMPILERHPEAKVVCHGRGLKFLVDPTRLWEGSLKVLGRLAETYGPPPPLPEDRLIAHTDIHEPGLVIVETPGHAVHHLSFSWRGRLFAGEAGGNLFRINGREYLRPATPPRFFLEEASASVDRLLELPDQPIHYAHFDRADSSHEMLGRFKNQLWRWKDVLARVRTEGIEAGAGQDKIEKNSVEALLAQDPELAAFEAMDSDTQDRERNFIRNSVRGYLEYLEKLSQ